MMSSLAAAQLNPPLIAAVPPVYQKGLSEDVVWIISMDERLAFSNSNQHFASTAPGWKTDRGRTYIVYGPPREIVAISGEKHPAQVWRYDSIPGRGKNVEMKFVDECNCDDYRLLQ